MLCTYYKISIFVVCQAQEEGEAEAGLGMLVTHLPLPFSQSGSASSVFLIGLGRQNAETALKISAPGISTCSKFLPLNGVRPVNTDGMSLP